MESLLSDGAALIQVILIDLALAGDNAIAVGLAASALPDRQQKRVIFIGVALALLLRIAFALVTVQLLQIKGLLLVGGLLLLWVAWRMWKDVRQHHVAAPLLEPDEGAALALQTSARLSAPASFGAALVSIVIADVSMSLDNVLAVAGVSRHSPEVMAFGLVLSVVLMGAAASIIASVIQRFRWIATVGILVIVLAAIRMVWEDAHIFLPNLVPAIPSWLGGHAELLLAPQVFAELAEPAEAIALETQASWRWQRPAAA